MQKIFNECVRQGHSVVNFNFPYFESGEEKSSGPELKEELETLRSVLVECKAKEYKHIRLIGKSLGAIIASFYLKSLSKEEQLKYSVVVFGYVTGSIDLKRFEGKIDVIQGEKDKFGNIAVVKNDLSDAVSKDISYFEIKTADHSYRNELKEPVFENEAIAVFRKIKWIKRSEFKDYLRFPNQVKITEDILKEYNIKL
jgi:predicted alpha/beta-hydrolase family hydrolase